MPEYKVKSNLSIVYTVIQSVQQAYSLNMGHVKVHKWRVVRCSGGEGEGGIQGVCWNSFSSPF